VPEPGDTFVRRRVRSGLDGELTVDVVAVASLATHFLVPAMTGLDESRALTALGLLVIALLAFAVAVEADAGSPE
jgi:hypothetical protein